MSFKKARVKPMKVLYNEEQIYDYFVDFPEGAVKVLIQITNDGWHIKSGIDKQSVYLYLKELVSMLEKDKEFTENK